jgi:hypothetical protein
MIANVERDLGTIMYSKDGRLWLIHHTRAFRKNTSLKQPRASLVAIGKSSIARKRSIATRSSVNLENTWMTGKS